MRVSYWDSLAIRAHKSNCKVVEAHALNNVGYIFYNNAAIENALIYWLRGLKLQEELNDKRGMASTLNNIAALYDGQNDYLKSLEYHKKSLKIKTELNDQLSIAVTLNNMGSAYLNQKKLDLAYDYFNKSLKIREALNDTVGTAISLSNIGCVFDEHKNYETALSFFKRSLVIYEATGDKYGIAYTLNYIGTTLAKQGKLDEALKFGLKGFSLANELKYPDYIKRTASLLYSVYREQKKFDKSLEMYELFMLMKDSVNNVNTRKSTVKQQLKYEYEKREAVFKAEQEKKDILAADQSKRQHMIIIAGSIGLLCLMIVAFFIYLNSRQKLKANVLLTSKNQEIEQKQKEILDSIHYAKRIQTALLPHEKYISRTLDKLNNK